MSQSNKKQKISHYFEESRAKNDKGSIQIEFFFVFEWFLVELGRNLLSKSDRDLINILCLNREINQRATPLFKNLFLNLELQSQVRKLVKEQKFQEVEKIFIQNGQVLNPNIKFNYPPNTPLLDCVHVHEVFKHEHAAHNCTVPTKDVSLANLACRNNLPLLLRSILFHRRMDWSWSSIINRFDVGELLDWSISNGNLEIFKLIMSNVYHRRSPLTPRSEKGKRIGFSSFQINFAYDVAAALVFQRKEMLVELMRERPENPHFVLVMQDIDWELEYQFIRLAFESGLEFLEIYLKSPIPKLDFEEIFSEKFPKNDGDENEPFMTIVKATLFQSLRGPTVEDEGTKMEVMKKLWNIRNMDKDHFFYALSWAFTFGMNDSLKKLLDEKIADDNDLLQIFRNFVPKNVELMLLMFERLEGSIKLGESDVGTIMKHLIVQDQQNFKKVWENSRILRTESWANNLLISAARSDVLFAVNTLSEHINLKSKMDFELPSQDIKFRDLDTLTCCWLSVLEEYRSPKVQDMDKLQQLLKIEWTEVFLKQAISVTQLDTYFEWLMLNKSIPSSFWTKPIVRFLLLKICSIHIGNNPTKLFSVFFKQFPNIDFSENNNEALITFLDANRSLDRLEGSDTNFIAILKQIVKKCRFQDLKEKIRVIRIANDCLEAKNVHLVEDMSTRRIEIIKQN